VRYPRLSIRPRPAASTRAVRSRSRSAPRSSRRSRWRRPGGSPRVTFQASC